MLRAPFLKFFPPPRYLERRAVGLDISDRSIKYAKLEWSAGRRSALRLERFGEVELPAGVVEGGQIKNQTALGAALRGLREKTGLREVVFSLPEEQAFLLRLFLPEMAEREVRQSLELQLEEYVPLPAERLFFDYEVVSAPAPPAGGAGYELAVSAFPRATVLDYLAIITAAGFSPVAAEIEGQAVARAILPPPAWPADRRARQKPDEKRGATLLVDFGRARTGFALVDDGRVVATATVVTIGGELVTAAIQKSLNVSPAEAERLKLTTGLLATGDDRRVLFALLPIVSVLRDEINKFRGYWETHGDLAPPAPPSGGVGGAAPPFRRRVTRVLLTGGQATLPGLVQYLAGGLGLAVELGDVWTNILDARRVLPPIKFNDSFKYATALGLALRDFNHYL